MSWLLNSMDYEEPDNLSDALLVSDGSPRDEVLAPPVAAFDKLRLPHGILNAANSPTSNNRFDFGRFLVTNGIDGSIDQRQQQQQHLEEMQHYGNLMNDQPADGRPSRCRILGIRLVMWMYFAAFSIGMLDKLLDLHILPESTIPLLFGGLLAVILSATLCAVMPTIVAVCEIFQQERRLHAGAPR